MLVQILLLSLGGAIVGVLSAYSKYQFREKYYDTREDYLEARSKSIRRRAFLFAFIVLVLSTP